MRVYRPKTYNSADVLVENDRLIKSYSLQSIGRFPSAEGLWLTKSGPVVDLPHIKVFTIGGHSIFTQGNNK